MSTITFADVADLVNRTSTTQINILTPHEHSKGWQRYTGQYAFRSDVFPFTIIYLPSDITQDGIKSAGAEAQTIHPTPEVVYAPSLLTRQKSLLELLRRVFPAKARFYSLRDYLYSFIKDEISRYIEILKAARPKYYADPPTKVPAGFRRRIPNPLLSFLTDEDPGSGIPDGAIAVLLADPGQGKTYLSKYLVSTLCDRTDGLIPILVDSSQWSTLSVSDLESLWKTVTHSFRYYHAAIPWIEGHEDVFLRTSLKAGLFRLVFDGFDEYILRNRGHVRAIDVLEALSELSADTGARIVLTSRTTFWNQNLATDEADAFLKRTGSFQYELLPFDPEHARNYFIQRLESPEKIEAACRLYESLLKVNKDLVGRGFVLALVADLVERDGNAAGLTQSDGNALFWLVGALYSREIVRQDLPLSLLQQRDLCKGLAEISVSEDVLTTDAVDLCVNSVAPSLDGDEREQCISKLGSHPIIERIESSDRWHFKQPQVRILLLADLILDRLYRNTDGREVVSLVKGITADGGTQQDMVMMIIDLLQEREVEEERIAIQLARLIHVLADAHSPRSSIAKLAGEFVSISIDKFRPKGCEHAVRSSFLKTLVGGEIVAGVCFTGTIGSLDLRGMQFKGCGFERVGWVNCTFDDRTIFSRCELVGGMPPIRCVGAGDIKLADCKLDEDARAIAESVSVQAGRRRYSVEHLTGDVKAAIAKFMAKGGMGVQPVEEGNIRKGTFGFSPYCNKIIESLCRHVIEVHLIRAGRRGFNVREDAKEAVLFYANNNVMTGGLQVAFDELRNDLIKA